MTNGLKISYAIAAFLLLSSCGGGGEDAIPLGANTNPATGITTTTAFLNGTVNPGGRETYAWFEFDDNPEFSSPAIVDNALVGSGNAPVPKQSPRSGLTPYRTYYFRMVAGNPGGTARGAAESFPTGVYFVAVGDSITQGTGDDDASDGIGFEPVLDLLLEAEWNFPVRIVNAGVGGVSSADGAASIGATLAAHPDAKYFLILYGTNDSDSWYGGPVPAETFKANLQSIVSSVAAAGKIPCLAKVPYTTNGRYSIPSINSYNEAIDQLAVSNLLPVAPPDLYGWFQAHQSELDAIGLHPDGTGYRSMANLWFWALTS